MHNTSRTSRRGNTLILVIGILILLILIAIMFIVKSQSIRITASAQREASRINEQARTIGRSVAGEVALQLFPSELVASNDGNIPSSGNSRRKAPLSTAVRYGHDRNATFNFAPYDVVPWTNPPDLVGVNPNLPPFAGPANPRGGPSIGDSRWLRDTEPLRADLFDLTGSGNFMQDGTPETFTHWRHLSNISKSDNAWRIIPDITDVSTTTGILSNLDLPVEQWPNIRPLWNNQGNEALLIGQSGYPSLIYDESGVDQYNAQDHHNRMMSWTNPADWNSWSAMQYDPQLLPQNFLDLSDLDGDGVHNEVPIRDGVTGAIISGGERYYDAFVTGTDRWYVERSLTDTDGDGFTDAFWHLSPLPSSSDTRQIVAISVVDNSALLNANVATQFISNTANIETRGHTPADLALIGTNFGSSDGRVGYYDSFANLPGNANFSDLWVEYDHTRWDPIVDWDTFQWDSNSQSSFLDELGIEKGLNLDNLNDANPVFDDGGNYNPSSDVRSQYGRLWYWYLSGRDPFNATDGFRPFTLADELELRYYGGNNAQAISSRFEVTLNNPQEPASGGIVVDQFLRSSVLNAHESSELRDQLDNKQLLYDNRRKLTLFNSARNDLLPPWLRWEERFWNRYDPDLEDYPDGLGLPYGYDTFNPDRYSNLNLTPGETFNVFASAYPQKIVFEAFMAINQNGIDALDFVLDNWRKQSRSKVDLRGYYADTGFNPWWESNADGILTLAERAPLQILLAMTNAQEDGYSNVQGGYNADTDALGELTMSAYGPTGSTRVPVVYSTFDWDHIGDDKLRQTRLMASGFASNMLTYRDEDTYLRQHSPSVGISTDPTNVFSPRSELALSQMVSPPAIGRQNNYTPIETLFVENQFPGPNSPLPNEQSGGNACCIDFSCNDMAEAQCENAGGYFVGEDIQCSTNPCNSSIHSLGVEAQPFLLEAFVAHVHKGKLSEEGACCIGGSVCIDISEDTCIALYGGHFAGVGSDCDGDDGIPGTSDDACGEQGACCIPNGGCIFVNQTTCDLLEGEFMGIGEQCEDNTCTGACCLQGINPLNPAETNCLDEDMSSFTCNQLGGIFRGHGTLCSDDTADCLLTGSCCFDSGSCVDVLQEANCISMGGTYNPDIFCIENPCPLGACCLEEEYGSCVEVTKRTCENDLDGTYLSSVSCDMNPCATIGACCFGSGSCVNVMSPAACEADGGTYLAGASCNAAPSTITQFPTQDTWIQEASETVSHSDSVSMWAGEQGNSNRVHVLIDFDIDENQIANRTILSATLSLAYNQHSGSPSSVTVARVTEAWTGDATWNTTNGLTAWSGGGGAVGAVDLNNPVPTSFVVGVDVAGGAQTIDLTDFVIDAVKNREGFLSLAILKTLPDGFNSRTEFSTIDAPQSDDWPVLFIQVEEGVNPCVASCCLETGLCKELSETTCAEYGGEYIAGASCGSFPCSASCCLNEGDCVDISRGTCDSFGGTYLGVGTSCIGSSCQNGICCFASGSCLNVYSAESCSDIGGNEYVDGATCSDTSCLFLGACCYDMGNCETISRDSCDMLSGNYLGIGTECGDDNANCGPIGACCLFNGTNRAWLNELRYGLPRIWLNELHYDDEGEDFNEFIEIAIDATIDPSAVNVYLYDGLDDDGNGITGEVYDSMNLSEFDVGQLTGGMVLYVNIHRFASDFILQDGRIDGLAITFTDAYDVEHVVQFLSYEGDEGNELIATNGPAAGLTAIDLGDRVNEEPPPSALNTSIGLQGSGSSYDDFSWEVFDEGLATPGEINETQSITEPAGGTVHELIEVAIGNDVLLSIDNEDVDVNIVLYNGTDGLPYQTYSLIDQFTQGEVEGEMTLFSRGFAAGELQNGGTNGDGIAIEILFDDSAVPDIKRVFCYVRQFTPVGYARGGGAVFMIPEAVVPGEVGTSIGLTGQSSTYILAENRFIWVAFAEQTAIPTTANPEYPSTNEGEKISSAEGDYGGCIEITEIGCDSIDGVYSGDDVSCGSVPCAASNRGACCFFTGGCADIPELNCHDIGGDWNGEDINGDPVSCTDGDVLPCQPVGACCLQSGSCHEISQDLCEGDLNGIYQGDAVSCTDELCVDPLGACCTPLSECLENVSAVTCLNIGGSFFVDCASAECQFNRGGCCFESGTCLDVRTEEICQFLGGEYAGTNIFCIDNPCSGSCCLDSGACIDTSEEEDCQLLGGEFLQYRTCSERPCVGACCVSRDECRVLSKPSCAQKDIEGSFMGFGTDCSIDDPCNQGDLGACCLNSGEFCVNGISEGACNTLDGVHFIDEVCESLGLQCPVSGLLIGACCITDTQCTMVESEDACDILGGTYAGDGTTCAENTCAGGCCLESGSCINTDQAHCEDDLGGQYIEEPCSTTPCRLACCVSSGSCVDVEMLATCTHLGGEPRPFGTSCASNPCSGACCLDQLGCEYVSAPSCNEMFGAFLGEGVPCEDTTCIEGSCCLGSGSCLESSAVTCASLGGTFKTGLCVTDPCLGACCLWAGGCEMLSVDTCEGLWDPDEDGQWSPDDAPGYFNGFGTQCDDNIYCVPNGSCCLPSGTCIDIMSIGIDQESSDFFYFCETVLGGIFKAGELCEDRECDRACCLPEGGCIDTSTLECERRAGLYKPDDMCSDDPCQEGACCFDSGSCNNIAKELCEGVEEEGTQGLGTWSGGDFEPYMNCDTPGKPGVSCTAYFLVTNDLEDCPQETISVVQIANPFSRDVDLGAYSVEFFGQEIKLNELELPNGGMLEPSTYEKPATLILYSIPQPTDGTLPNVDVSTIVHSDEHIFDRDWLDFLDIQELKAGEDIHPENTLIVRVPNVPIGEYSDGWSTSRTVYDGKLEGKQNSVAIYRFDDFHDDYLNEDVKQRVLVDRLEIIDTNAVASRRFETRVVEEMQTQFEMLEMDDHPAGHEDQKRSGYITLTDSDGEKIPVLDKNGDETAALFVQWDRATRAWAVDMPQVGDWHNDEIDSWEENPRFVFAAHDFIRSDEKRWVTNFDNKVIWGDQFEEMEHTTAFHWSEYEDPDDEDGDGNPDDAAQDPDGKPNEPDPDLLPDFPDPWFTVRVWSPRAGDFRPTSFEEGEVVGGLRDRKPTYFDMNMLEDPSNPINTSVWSYPDKGWYGQRSDLDADMSTSNTPAFEDGQVDGEPDDTLNNDVIDYEEIDMTMNFPMQMLQKDGDFEQVGELLNVWLFGHLVEGEYYATIPGDYLRTMPSPLDYAPDSFEATYVDAGTVTTFSEFMYPDEDDWWAEWVAPIVNGEVVLDERVNRLRFQSQGDNNIPVMLDGRSAIDSNGIVYSLDHPWPRLSVAARILDSFVCDGPGNPDTSVVLTEDESYWHSYYNANAYSGKGTPGLININTAPLEVLRTLPHMYKMVHPTGLDSDDINPRTMLPEAMVQWREQSIGSTMIDDNGDGIYDVPEPNVLYDAGNIVGPNYSNRTNTTNLAYGYGPKHTRGFSSPAEIGMLNRGGVLSELGGEEILEPWHIEGDHQAIIKPNAWRIDFASLNPYANWNIDGVPVIGAPLGTETTAFNEGNDEVSFDIEEENLLQTGISNMITTTSDMFTIYMRIRSFKRNPVDGSWDATNLDYIIDDSRYVMLVDRSNVNSPSDKPKILYFEKLPN